MTFVFNFLSSLYGKPEYRLLLIGLDAAGRTTALYRMKLGETITTIPTIGFNVEEINHKGVKLTFWDVGGCDKIRPLWRHYFSHTQAIVFVVDSNDRERLNEVEWSLGLILNEDELRDSIVLVLANKKDLPGAMRASEVIHHLKLNNLKNKTWACMETCATSGEGLNEALDWLVKSLKKDQTTPKVEKPTEIVEEKDDILTRWLKQEDESDEDFLNKFQNYNLDAWDHRTHLRIAWLYLTKEGRKKGMEMIFSGIRNYIANSKSTHRSQGTTFHETLTYFWVHMVDYAIKATLNPNNSFKGFLVTNPQLSNGGMYLDYYIKETMMNNPDARVKVVLPDKKPLPSILSDIRAIKVVDASKSLKPLESLTDEEFYRSFRNKTLNSWGHKSFIRVIWYVLNSKGRRDGAKEVFVDMENFMGNGYHLTLTYFWIHMVDLNMRKYPACESFDNFWSQSQQVQNEEAPMEFYSKNILYQGQAHKEMVLPNKKNLPSVIF